MITLKEYWDKFNKLVESVPQELKSFEKTKERREWLKPRQDELDAQLSKEDLKTLKERGQRFKD